MNLTIITPEKGKPRVVSYFQFPEALVQPYERGNCITLVGTSGFISEEIGRLVRTSSGNHICRYDDGRVFDLLVELDDGTYVTASLPGVKRYMDSVHV